MTIRRGSIPAALIAGALALAADRASADHHVQGEKSSTSADQTGTDPKRSGAMGSATTEQQSRSGERTGASGQSDATEAPGKSTGTPHARSGSDVAGTQRGAQGDELSGRVEGFDHATRTLTIAGRPVQVDERTEVTKDGQKAALTDIEQGDEVRASLSGSGDAATAQRLEVTSSSAPADAGSAGGTTQPAPSGTGR